MTAPAVAWCDVCHLFNVPTACRGLKDRCYDCRVKTGKPLPRVRP
jgi:hypothetical protein